MDKFQLRLTPDEAERWAAILAWYAQDEQLSEEVRDLKAAAARLNHLAARARARAARAGTE